MHFDVNPELEAFRQEVRAFLKANLPQDLIGIPRVGRSPPFAQSRWQKILNSKGWGAPYWSGSHGGNGWTVQQQLLFDEECVAAGAPTQDVFAHKLLGPVLNTFGSDAQKNEHIRPILQGDRQWCQGFSEPGSGSDLASLRTRADRVGDHYIVNGQKIWTSTAHHADWIFVLVRTEQSIKKQAGISFLLIDMRTEGISVRPILSIDDCHHLNEVFFDDVKVPVSNLVGAEGEGWKITKFLLNNEHASTAHLPTLKLYMSKLMAFAKSLSGPQGRLCQQPDFMLNVARAQAEIQAIEFLVQRVAVLEQENDPAAHALGSMLKIKGTELQQKVTELLFDALGEYGPVRYPSPDRGLEAGEDLPLQGIARGLVNEMFFRRAATIYGGTNEIQRGIIARLLFRF